MMTDLVEAGDRLLRRDGVADARPRHAVRLRKRAQTDEARILGIGLGQAVSRREIGIGLVEHEEA